LPRMKVLLAVLLLLIGLVGIYLIFTSGQFDIDPYSVIVSLIVAGFIVYLYLIYFRGKN
jgi:hypothetical protein